MRNINFPFLVSVCFFVLALVLKVSGSDWEWSAFAATYMAIFGVLIK